MIYEKGYPYCFDESKCEECKGKCCTGESGFIFLTPAELSKLADIKNISFDEFKNAYCIKVGVRLSLKEKTYKNGFACIFFDEINQNCSVYEARPSQCRSFPFWEYYKQNIKEVEKECLGIKLY